MIGWNTKPDLEKNKINRDVKTEGQKEMFVSIVEPNDWFEHQAGPREK